MTRRQAHRGKDTVSGRGQSIGTFAQRSIGLNRLVDVKAARVAQARFIARPDCNAAFTLEDPIMALKRTNPNAPMAAWKLAAEQSFRRQRAQALKPLRPEPVTPHH